MFHRHVPAPLVWKSWTPPPPPPRTTWTDTIYSIYWFISWQNCIHELVNMDIRCSAPLVCIGIWGYTIKPVCSVNTSVYKLALFLGSHVWESLGTCKTIQTSTCHGSYHACDYLCSWAMRKNPGMKFFMRWLVYVEGDLDSRLVAMWSAKSDSVWTVTWKIKKA